LSTLPTTTDTLLGGKVLLAQPEVGFRTAIDAVLLAAAVAARPGEAVLDAGCGTGAALLCVAHRCADLQLVGLELEPVTAALARANVARNGVEQRVEIVTADLLSPPPELKGRAFAVVMTNPPFNAADGRSSASPTRALAMADRAGLQAWLRACLKRLAPRGRLVLIHRADRLPEVLGALVAGVGEAEIIPLWPAADGRPAKRVILRCRKGVKGPATLRQGLVLHDSAGKFTQAADAVLRGGATLDDVLPAG